MDQVFHVDCFTCIVCNNKLRGQPFYAVEKKAYCEPCYIVSSDLILSILQRCLLWQITPDKMSPSDLLFLLRLQCVCVSVGVGVNWLALIVSMCPLFV